jgi:hypothetical protein
MGSHALQSREELAMPDTNTLLAQPLEGKATVDTQRRFEPDMLSYRSAASIAAQLAEALKDEIKGHEVVIADMALLADFANLEAVYAEVDEMANDFKSLANLAGAAVQRRTAAEPATERMRFAVETFAPITPVAAATSTLAALSTGVSTALGLVSLFRQDVEFSGRQTTVDPITFELALAGALIANGAKRVVVADFEVSTASNSPQSLRGRLHSLHTARAKAWTAVAPLVTAMAQLELELDQASRGKQQNEVDRVTGELAQLQGEVQPLADPMSRLDSRLNDLEAKALAIDEKTGISLLARWIRAEAIRRRATIYLHAAVAASGGGFEVVRSLWRTKAKVKSSGGVVMRWAILATSGEILKAGVLDATDVLVMSVR